jgi:hypothetical protein
MEVIAWLVGYTVIATIVGAAWGRAFEVKNKDPIAAYFGCIVWPVTLAPAAAYIINAHWGRAKSVRELAEEKAEAKLEDYKWSLREANEKLEKNLGIRK